MEVREELCVACQLHAPHELHISTPLPIAGGVFSRLLILVNFAINRGANETHLVRVTGLPILQPVNDLRQLILPGRHGS